MIRPSEFRYNPDKKSTQKKFTKPVLVKNGYQITENGVKQIHLNCH